MRCTGFAVTADICSVAMQSGQSVYSRLLQTGRTVGILQCLHGEWPVDFRHGTLAMYLEFCLNHDFSRRADEQLALQLLQQGADAFRGASVEGSPPLHLCVRLGWQRLGQTLLALGADPNAVDVAGLTALHYAAQLGRVVLLKELLHVRRQSRAPRRQWPEPAWPCLVKQRC